jgi:hypothetical protein
MKLALTAVVLAFLAFLGVQIYSFSRRISAREAEYEAFAREQKNVEGNYNMLRAELDYFLRPENLEKELRARFNYRGAEEKMIIIVPGRDASAQTSQ